MNLLYVTSMPDLSVSLPAEAHGHVLDEAGCDAPARGSFHQTKRAFGLKKHSIDVHARPRMQSTAQDGQRHVHGGEKGEGAWGLGLLVVSDLSVGANVVSGQIFSLPWMSFSPPVGRLVGWPFRWRYRSNGKMGVHNIRRDEGLLICRKRCHVPQASRYRSIMSDAMAVELVSRNGLRITRSFSIRLPIQLSLPLPLSIPSESRINANFFNHTTPLNARCAASKKQRSSLCRSYRMQLWHSHYPAH